MSAERKRALISGVSGQDGSYLAELLIGLDYDVYGFLRRNSIPEHHDSRIAHLEPHPQMHTEYGDLLDTASLSHYINEVKPHEIYNLAAQSHVGISFKLPFFTAQVVALGALNMLEAYRQFAPEARYYQASSSEMFGNSVDPDGFQRLTTPMCPVSPYGCSKVFAYNMTRSYRNSYGLHACNGVLFNHESPRRGSNFVTQKVVKAACKIKLGRQDFLELGNLDSFRDWGHSKDYVRAMHLILQQPKPDDWLVATGQTHSVRELCQYVFGRLDLDFTRYVRRNERFVRPNELDRLQGDASRTREVLGWEPQYTFATLLDEMIEETMLRLQTGTYYG